MSHHKTAKKGPIYGEFNFAKGGSVYVKGYVRGGKVEKVMHEFKAGDLHSGSKTGPVVQNRKQAVAIAMSEAGKTKKMSHGGMVHGPMSDKDAKMAASAGPAPATSHVKKVLSTATKGYARGGLTNLTHKADNLDNPRPSGITPTTVNVKARMSPRYDKGGMVHPDAKQDKALIKKAIRQHDKNLHGGAKDPIKLKHGGKAK